MCLPGTVKPVLNGHSQKDRKAVWYLIVSIPDFCTLTYFQDQLSLNAGQKYCRMLQGEHSATLSTFIKLPFVIKIFVLSIFEFYTGFSFFSGDASIECT